ncbi:retrovirus-related Pol polyprotein from transposon 17.6 [Trichonephila clavipes]|nr:retrovirus-related Pol polyprotein from transposon 17.6 [Trichonephila clavipes]
MQLICDMLEITQDLIPVYHPQANPSEHKNHDLKSRLAILVGEEHSAWEDKLLLIRFTMNTSVCNTTGHMAAYLQFGRQLRTSDNIRHDFRQVIDNDNFVPEITPYLKRFANSILDVKDRVEQKQDCQKENFDRRRSYYKPGDKVWVTIHLISRNNRSRKFMPKREGPYLILALRSPVTYQIADPTNPDQALGTYHVAAVAEWYRYRTVACIVTGSSPVPLKTRRVGQRCTLNLSRAETSSRWCGVVVRRGGCQLRCRPRHLTMVQNYVVRRQKPSCS